MKFTASEIDDLSQMANAIRFLTVDAIEHAQSGHPGMPMGMADIATVLFRHFLNFNPHDPAWLNRDRLIVSNGHGSMLLYACAYLTGYKGITLEDLKKFRQVGSRTPGHPEHDIAIGIETTTGPLGQGLSNAVGMAISAAQCRATYGSDLFNHKTYVLVGDGCLMEGISHEAASLAGHLQLNQMVVLFDDNKISIDGPTSLSVSENTIDRFRSYGWNTHTINGHNFQEIYDVLALSQSSDKPTFIACQTTIGSGSTKFQGTAKIHGSPLGPVEIQVMRQAAQWCEQPFCTPEPILRAWCDIPKRCVKKHQAWYDYYNCLNNNHPIKARLHDHDALLSVCEPALTKLFEQYQSQHVVQATRKSSGEIIEQLMDCLPHFIGGSADLTPSNLTKSKNVNVMTADNFSGHYIHYGIREHAMAACMNGIALYGQHIPFGGTFLAFSDYCRPALRLSAMMQQRVIYIMTHDSIGLGEDGPTHQPIEHLSALRAIPNLLVLRPADSIETIECWLIALSQPNRPSVLCLSRQDVPTLPRESTHFVNRSLHGGYRIASGSLLSPEQVTIIATGSEVTLAIKVQILLADKNINAQIISMPSQELYFEQSNSYRDVLIPANHYVHVIEAGSPQSWDRFVKSRDHITSINSFGVSGSYQQVYEHFGFTPEKIALNIEKNINK